MDVKDLLQTKLYVSNHMFYFYLFIWLTTGYVYINWKHHVFISKINDEADTDLRMDVSKESTKYI